MKALIAISDSGSAFVMRWLEVDHGCDTSAEEELLSDYEFTDTPSGIYMASISGSYCGGHSCRCGYMDCFEYEWDISKCIFALEGINV